MKVARDTLYLYIPVDRSESPDEEDVILFHVPPMSDDVHQAFGSDLIRAFDHVYSLDNIHIGMYGFLDFAHESIADRMTEQKAAARIERFDMALTAGFMQFGKVCIDGRAVPVPEALDAGLIDHDELDQAVSAYGFFSRALRSPLKGFAKATATTTQDAQSFARSLQSAQATLSQVAPETETFAQPATGLCTDSTTISAPLDAPTLGESQRCALVTGLS